MLHCMKIAIRSSNSFLIGSLAQKIAADGDDVCMIPFQHQHLPQDVDITTVSAAINTENVDTYQHILRNVAAKIRDTSHNHIKNRV